MQAPRAHRSRSADDRHGAVRGVHAAARRGGGGGGGSTLSAAAHGRAERMEDVLAAHMDDT
jgi:galactokinase